MNKLLKIEIIRNKNQYQLGIESAIHKHFDFPKKWHFHIWIDIVFYCIEISIGKYE